MLVSNEDATLFFEIYPPFIGYCNGYIDKKGKIKDSKTYTDSPPEERLKARNIVFSNPEVIDQYIKLNPNKFSNDILKIIKNWKYFKKGEFLIERDLKKHSIFLFSDEKKDRDIAYGVLGVSTEISELLPNIPAFVKAILLPWKGKIIIDGFLESTGTNIVFGGKIKKMFRKSYNDAKKRGIITSLNCDDQNWP